MSFVLPEHLASCPVCGCLVLVTRPDPAQTWTVVWDPSTPDRWKVERMVGDLVVRRQGFGLIRGGHHECPPEPECGLYLWERRECNDV